MNDRQSSGIELTPDPRDLILAVLGEGPERLEVADAILRFAQSAGIDPLDYCASRLRLGENTVLERAAGWAGFAFYPTIPAKALVGMERLHRLSGLGTARTVRGQVFDRKVLFYAPRFAALLALARARAENEQLARHLCFVPAHAVRAALGAAASDEMLEHARHRLTQCWHRASAEVDLPVVSRILFVALFLAAVGAVAIGPYLYSLALLPLVMVLIVPPALLRLAAVFRQPPASPPHRLLSDAELPVYSILIPLRDEAGMVWLLHRAMLRLDYPPEKLDIKFVVEQKSADTVAAVRAILDDPRFDLVLVPDEKPHTKPKALNYALPLVRGDHVVVYDAEDIPDPGQLRLAASRFYADPGLDCIQAELIIDNAEENWITAMFAAEYAGQFGLMLPLLAHWRLPLPLGGTSNHFRTAALAEVGNWDAYNVTEDADLGVRLSRLRYRTGVLDSETSEEAPISLDAWMVQRTRWIKGWMQTFLVHNRRPLLFLDDIGWRNFLFFQIYVGSLIVSSLLHTVFVLSLLLRGALGIWPDLSNPIDAAYVAIMLLGYGATFLIVVAGLARRRAWELIPQQLFTPLYWALHSIAALRAAHQLMVKPYFWGKTAHGRTRKLRRFR